MQVDGAMCTATIKNIRYTHRFRSEVGYRAALSRQRPRVRVPSESLSKVTNSLFSFPRVLRRGRAVVARKAHNLEVGGSNPSCAITKNYKLFSIKHRSFNGKTHQATVGMQVRFLYDTYKVYLELSDISAVFIRKRRPKT